jgi:hypothetical protein
VIFLNDKENERLFPYKIDVDNKEDDTPIKSNYLPLFFLIKYATEIIRYY